MLKIQLIEFTYFSRVRQPDAEEQSRQGRRGQPDLEINGLGLENLLQLFLDAFTHGGVVTVAGEEHHCGHETTERVLAEEQTRLAALVQTQHTAGGVVELVRRHVEQLVARVVLNDPQQISRGVAVRQETKALHHRLHLVTHQRGLMGGHGIGAAGEQPQDQVFTGDRAVLGEDPNADVIQVFAPVNRGPAIGLGHEKHFTVPCVQTSQTGKPLCVSLGAFLSQQSQPGVRAGLQGSFFSVNGEVVPFDPHEHEVAGPQPVQELGGGVHVRQLGAIVEPDLMQAVEGTGDLVRHGEHLVLIFIHPADIRNQPPAEVATQLFAIFIAQGAVQHDPDPRFDPGVRAAAAAGSRGGILGGGNRWDGGRVPGRGRRNIRNPRQRFQLMGLRITSGQQQRVDHQFGATPLGGDLGVQRGHQERHVVGDQVENGVALVLAHVNAHVPRWADPTYLPVGRGHGREPILVGGSDVGVGDRTVVLVDPLLLATPLGALPRLGNDLGVGRVGRGHVCITPLLAVDMK